VHELDPDGAAGFLAVSEQFRSGDRFAMMEAARIALWQMSRAHPHLESIYREFTAGVDRWRDGSGRSLGAAFGIPDQKGPAGLDRQFVERDGARWNAAAWVWHRTTELRQNGRTRALAFEEIARDLCTSVDTVERLYDRENRAARRLRASISRNRST